MHLNDQIEEYNFTHGKHFDVSTGQYDLLMPHDLGRPLTHEEMDYNFIYQKQTLNGFRIFGSGVNLRLDSNDLNKVLKFHQIALADSDYALYVAEGYAENQYIWVPEELVSAPSGVYITLGVQAQLNEGQVALFTLTSANIPNNTTVGYTLSGIQAADLVNPSDMTGIFTMDGTNTSQLTIAIANDFLTEGTEIMLMTLDAADSLGISAGLTAQVDINDTSLTPVYTSINGTATMSEGTSSTWTVQAANFYQAATISWEVDFTNSTATPADFTGATSGTVNMNANGVGTGITLNIATDSVSDNAESFVIKLIGSDSNGISGNNLSKSVTISDVAYPEYLTFTGPNSKIEGDTLVYTVSSANVPNGTTIGYTITGSAGFTVNDITLSSLTGTFTMNADSSSLSFNLLEDNITEGLESLTITLDAQDNQGTQIGLPMSVTTALDDVPSGYSITGANSINEGVTETYVFRGSNVPANTTVYWELRNVGGSGHTFPDDFTSLRTGSGVMVDDGGGYWSELDIDITPALDQLVEGDALISLVVWDDASNYDNVVPHNNTPSGELAKKNINILDLAPVYTLIASPSQTEPSTLIAELYTQYVDANTAYTWEVVSYGGNPADANDFNGGVLPSGSGTIPTYNSTSQQSDTFNISVIADNLTEGVEQYEIIVRVATVQKANKIVDITDTSQTLTWDCNDAGLVIPDGDEGEAVTGTVTAGTLVSNSFDPAVYTLGITEYDAQITAPAGYSNSGQIITCSDNVTVTPTPLWGINSGGAFNEGVTMTWDVQTQYVPVNETYTWNTIPSNTNQAAAQDFDPSGFPSGSGTVSQYNMTMTNDPNGQFTITAAIDGVLEPNEYFTIQIFDQGGNLVTSKEIRINDTTPTWDCTDAGLSISTGTVGDPVTGSLSGTGTLVSFNPSTYQSGTTSYTADITVPANDPNGNPYSNAGQTEQCSANGTGNAPQEAMYWMHLGETPFPYQKDLMGAGPFYYEATNGQGGPGVGEESDFAPIFEDMVNNPSDWTVSPGSWGSQLTLSSGDQFNFVAGTGSNFYYFLIPDSYGISDLTTTQSLSAGGGPNDTAAEKKTGMTINGISYTMYRVNAADSTNPLMVQYN